MQQILRRRHDGGDTKNLADLILDRTGAVKRPPYARLLCELWAFATYFAPPPDPADLPNGRGHVVLLVPAYLTGDFKTAALGRFLTSCGYRPIGWANGINWGPTPRALAALRARLSEACALEGGPVSVVGISLGGVLARDLAYDRPADIRCVVTLASPFRVPTASTLAPLIRLSMRFMSPKIDIARLASPLPVPSTTIYTREDGIVAWESCCAADPGSTSVEVSGPHITISRRPEVRRAVVRALAASGA